jgi:hypothetical protein
VAAHDAALLVRAFMAHVVLARLARVTLARPPHRRHHQVAGSEALHLPAHLFDNAEVLVAEDQVLIAVGRLSVEPMVDFGVGAAEPDANHLHRHLIRPQLRIGHVAHVDRVFHARLHDNGFHGYLSSSADSD